jgi:LPXTG-site transpeptidase (sortase) family protein
MARKEQIIKHRKTINLIFRTVGNTLVILSIFFLTLGFWPYLEAEFKYNWNQVIGQKYYVAGDKISGTSSPLGAVLAAPPPITISPVNTDFSIIIPKLDVSSAVVQEVNAANYSEYMQALVRGAAHAKGTVFPGEAGNSFIFAHSTLNFWDVARYNAIFTLLRKLEIGDHIVTFYKGQRYDYYVTEKLTLDPGDLRFLTPLASGRQLTLQTCDPPGTTIKRLLIVAKMH